MPPSKETRMDPVITEDVVEAEAPLYAMPDVETTEAPVVPTRPDYEELQAIQSQLTSARREFYELAITKVYEETPIDVGDVTTTVGIQTYGAHGERNRSANRANGRAMGGVRMSTTPCGDKLDLALEVANTKVNVLKALEASWQKRQAAWEDAQPTPEPETAQDAAA